ncbi:hypothetical protein TPHV1_40068 [Treponema phagedenis]|uniref:Uncharacterized protein n=1 Tax=Treponema phagedenis TaxID=162 RepID=A0A0B7H014_TREPH|nr:hypothetical protein TPHV1_40068 [Treponema phagedenis]
MKYFTCIGKIKTTSSHKNIIFHVTSWKFTGIVERRLITAVASF